MYVKHLFFHHSNIHFNYINSVKLNQNQQPHARQNPSYLGCVDEFISQTLGDGLDVTESGFTGARAQQPDSLVYASKWAHVNSLSADSTCTTDTGRVFTGSGVDYRWYENLEWKKIVLKLFDKDILCVVMRYGVSDTW